MAPYPGQARCLALGFWPECFRRLDVKGGRRPFPEETRSALDIEGKHVTIQGPSPDLSQARSLHLPPVVDLTMAAPGSRTAALEGMYQIVVRDARLQTLRRAHGLGARPGAR